ncbi:MAG TPA: ATP-binding protein [Candidatus Acidoferrales bacterium]|jgi:PAS domain S-box-containing protein|nr:ATP-binding protein [Candidatus Acidoferrales bacterium]
MTGFNQKQARTEMNRLRLNIGPRLVLCFALIILSTLAGDVIVLWQFHIVHAQAERLNEYDEELVTVLRVHSDLLKFRDTLESLANAKNAERLNAETQSMNEAFAEDMRRAKSALLAVHSYNASDPTTLPTLAVVQSTLRSQTASMIDLAEADDWNAVQLRLADQLRPLEFSTSALVERVDREVKTEHAQAAANIRQVQHWIFIVVPTTVVLTLLIAGTLGLVITRSITRPLEQLVKGSKMLARGEFKHRVPIHGEDELAQLGHVFNDTARRLQDLYESLQGSEDRLRRVINTIPAHVWSTLSDGSVDFINQRLLESTGLSVEALLGSGWQSIVHPDDRTSYLAKWRSALAAGEPVEIEARVWTAQRDYRWLLVRNVPLRDGHGGIVKWYGTGIDIEDRKRAEESLLKAQADLAHANRVTTMGELSASLAHEINQPISGTITNASTCLRRLDREQPDLEGARVAASRVIRDANRAAEIINRVKLFFRKGVVTKERVDLNEMIREMEILLHNEATQHSVSVQTKLAAELPLIVADRVQLQQVLMNLMINGIDAMKAVDAPRQLTLGTQNDSNEQLLVSVEDTGIGLPHNQADEIFNAFFTTKEHGTGMGLRISRTIIEAHGGRLWATANYPRGASFHFTLAVSSGAGSLGVRSNC